jgi:NhaP-type Na+/H+ or K+/H+ antiporter
MTFIIAGSTALFLHHLPNNLGMLIAALLGVTAGVIVQHLQLRFNKTGNDHAA